MTRNSRCAIVALAAALLLLHAGAAWAAKTPFGIITPDAPPPTFTGPLGSLFAWVAYYQSEFYKALTNAFDDMKRNGEAVYLLVGVSFLYGVFHAVGPGHGKAVITSYLLVSRQTVKRGIVISFAAALMQGLSAIVIVLIAAVLLRVTAVEMTRVTNWFEIISYALIAAVGTWLLWTKSMGGGHHAHAHDHGHAHDDHQGNDHDHHHGHAHDKPDHARDHAEASCGHSHVPDPQLLAQPLSLTRAWTAILAVGIRPCSGALIVLVFALSQRLLIVGIGSVLAMSFGTFITVSALALLAVSAKDVALRLAGAESETAVRIIRAVEIGGALFVMLLGLTLLGGALEGGLPT
jgi:nickel/cobalt transporter (NicO) family protein